MLSSCALCEGVPGVRSFIPASLTRYSEVSGALAWHSTHAQRMGDMFTPLFIARYFLYRFFQALMCDAHAPPGCILTPRVTPVGTPTDSSLYGYNVVFRDVGEYHRRDPTIAALNTRGGSEWQRRRPSAQSSAPHLSQRCCRSSTNHPDIMWLLARRRTSRLSLSLRNLLACRRSRGTGWSIRRYPRSCLLACTRSQSSPRLPSNGPNQAAPSQRVRRAWVAHSDEE